VSWPYEPPPAGPVPVADVETVLPPRRRSRWKVWVALAAVLVVATGVTAVVLTRSDGKSTVAILESAPGNTRSAGTAQLTSTISFTIGGETRAVVRIDGRNNFLDKQADVSVSGQGFREEIRVVGGVEYVSQNLVPLPGGAAWVRIDPKTDLGVDQARSPLGSGDPSTGLDFLAAVIGDPHATGTENIDGTDATHYVFTLDLSDITKLVRGAEDKLGAQQLADGMKALERVTDLHHVPGEAWIDADGRVIRMTVTLALTGQNGARLVEVQQTDFSDFGDPVDVSVPDGVVPFAQVPDLFSQITSRAQSLGGA
jgi:hypothetical protein